MSMDADDDMNIEALEELLASSASMEELEKNAELDEADAAFFDQLEDQIEDLNGDTNGTGMNFDFTEPDESVSDSNLLEEPVNAAPLENIEESTENTALETSENDQVEESDLVEESKPIVTAETEVDSLRGSSHSMQSQTLDSDDDPELMNNIDALKEEEAVESSAVDDAAESENASSLSKSIDVFSKLLPSHSVDGSVNLSADLQATAKALAAVSPNFEIGVKGKKGLFGRFRRSGAPVAPDGDREEEEAKAYAGGDAVGEEGNETPSKESKSGFFGPFRGKSKQDDQEAGDEIEETAKDEADDTDKDGEETITEANSNSSTGFFGSFRASPKSETQETKNDEDKEEGENVVETDSNSGGGLFSAFRASPKSENQESSNEEKPDGEETTTTKSTTPESGSRFNIFRQFGEIKKDKQRAMNLSPFEEADSEDNKTKRQATRNGSVLSEEKVDDPADSGPGMFGYVSRKREEWNRRGTIDFPQTGPYSERTVRVGKVITEGSLTSVFHATHYEDNETLYVLKRINVLDDATREVCEKESIISNVLSDQQECIMPMLGYMVDEEQSLCYMLFPFMHLSLQAEMDVHFAQEGLPEIPPWDEKVALYMFYLLLHAVDALHGIGYSHRNIQVENIYLSSWKRPVLSGFKNAGPLSRTCSSAKDIFEIANTASQSTNMAYRPPELFPGAVMVGHDPLNYCLADCWSLGCTLFAMMYGVSPFECTFDPETSAMVKQECNQLSILADIPFPPAETPVGQWYSDDVKELILFILEKDRAKRPSLALIQAKVSSLLTKETGPHEVPDVSETTDMEDFQS